jgi:ABC-2 type transport system permease protein
MLAIWATFIKELIELRRDKAGLLVLLVMPMALVLIVSLVQDSVMQATGEAPIRVLFVDKDRSFLGTTMEKQLRAAGGLEIVTRIKEQELTEEQARKLVVKGDYQFCVIIPPGTGKALRERITRSSELAFAGSSDKKDALAATPLPENLTILFDPAVQGAFRTAVVSALQSVMLGIEFRERGEILSRTLPLEMKKMMTRMMATGSMDSTMGLSGAAMDRENKVTIESEPVLRLSEASAVQSRLLKRPTAAQQNVPAWALFGMFFIVVPLSGVLIRERHTGTYLRLMTMPVAPLSLLAGKVCAYVLVCMGQFALMLVAGIFLLPLLGTAGLTSGPELVTILPVVLAASLAATGYGLLVGTLAKTYEQASMFGAVSIVIAAALGGIMIPVYVMPRYMQEISTFSPLAWGLTAFQDIFVRGGNLHTVLREVSYLIMFFLVAITIAGVALRNNRTQ